MKIIVEEIKRNLLFFIEKNRYTCNQFTISRYMDMKKIILLLLFPLIGNSQKEVSPIKGDTLFMLKTEVSNEMYREFLNDLPSCEKLKNTPDSTKWRRTNSYLEPFVAYYFQHPAYNKYPVVNITQKNAKNFCKWKSKVLNNNSYGLKVEVRLPTEFEWEFAAKAGNLYAIYPWGTEKMRIEKGKNKGTILANYVQGKSNYQEDGATITAKIHSYFPNPFGLYNMSGNVEEMVAEKGITKGGSWNDRANLLRIDSHQKVYSASPEVGFRYVVVILEKGNRPKKSFFKRIWNKIIRKKECF